MLRTRDPGVARCEHGQLAAVDIKVNVGEVLAEAPQAPAHERGGGVWCSHPSVA